MVVVQRCVGRQENFQVSDALVGIANGRDTFDAIARLKAESNHMTPSRIKQDVGLTYEVVESREFRDHWHVEAIDPEGRIFVAVFSGPDAQERAAEYADWKNGIRHPAAVLELVR